jgi:hypothetical protein
VRSTYRKTAELHVPEVEVVGSAAEDDGVSLRLILRPVDIGSHTDTVLHGHHHLAVDDGDVFELLLDGRVFFDEGGELSAGTLGERGDRDGTGATEEVQRRMVAGFPDFR